MKCLSKVMIILLVFLFFDFNSGWHTVHGQNDHPKLSTNSVAREEDNEEIVEHHATNIRHDSRNISLSITYGKLFVAKIQHCSGNAKLHDLPSWFYFDRSNNDLIGFPFSRTDQIVHSVTVCDELTIHLVWSFEENIKQATHIRVYLDELLSSQLLIYRLLKKIELSSNNNYGVFTQQQDSDSIRCDHLLLFGNNTNYNINIFIGPTLRYDEIEDILLQETQLISGFSICSQVNDNINGDMGDFLVKLLHERSRRNAKNLSSVLARNPNVDCEKNNPPIAIAPTVTQFIKLNAFDHISLNKTLFSDADLPTLKLQLRWGDGSSISTSDWLEHSEDLEVILTWATYATFLNQPRNGYQFLLTATDQCNAQTSLQYFIKVQPYTEKPPCFAFILLVESVMDVKTPYLYVLTDVVKIMAASFNDSKMEHHLIQDFKEATYNNKSVYQIFFSHKNIACSPCDINKIKTTLEFIQNDQSFHHSFIPNFKYLGVTTQWDTCGGDSKPIVLCPISELTVSMFGVLVKKLPQNTFFDAEDGFTGNLKLEVLDTQTASFLGFVQDMTLVIYQMKHWDSKKKTFILQAKDSDQLTAVTPFTVKRSDHVISPLGEFLLKFNTYYEQWMTKEQILVRVLMILSEYLSIPIDYEKYIITAFKKSKIFPQSIELHFTMRSFFAQSGLQMFLQIRNKLFYNGVISSKFSSVDTRYIRNIAGSFRDSFDHSAVTPNSVTTTTRITTGFPKQSITPTPSVTATTTIFTSPSPSPDAPIVRFKIGPFEASFCNFFVFPIPENLFYDKTDGYTRQLKLLMRTAADHPLPIDSWVQLDADIQVIYGYLKVSDYEEVQSKQVTYRLVATNSKGLSTHLFFDINLPKVAPHLYYTINMKVSSFYQPNTPTINEQLLLMTKISAYLGNPSNFSWMSIVSFSRQKEENVVTVAWTNCTLTNTSACPLKAVQSMASKVVLKNDVANSNFARSLSPHYILHSISAEINHLCFSTTSVPEITSSSIRLPPYPKVMKPIDPLTIHTSTYFRYKIPSDTFYDSKDGTTPYLSLAMVDMTGKPLQKSSWIQFNNLAQEIYANVYIDVLEGLSTKIFKYVVIATNSYNRVAHMVITVRVTREHIPLGGIYVDVNGEEYLSNDMNDLQVLTHIMQRYFRYAGSRDQTEVESFTRPAGHQTAFNLRFVYNFASNDSFCNQRSLDHLSSKLKTQDHKIQTQFIVAFLMEVSISSVSIQKFGVCLHIPTTTTSTTIAATTISNAPLILNQLPVIEIKSHTLFQFQIPRTTFFQAPDMYTPSFSLQLLNAGKTPVAQTSWITLTDQQQLRALLERHEDTGNIVFYIRATNQWNLYTDMKLVVKPVPITAPTTFRVVFTGNQLFPENSSKLTLLFYFLQKYNFYIYSEIERSDTLIVNFTRHAPPSKWFSLTLSDAAITDEKACGTEQYRELMSKFYTPQSAINPRLIVEFYPTISISNLEINSICNKPTITTTTSAVTTTAANDGLIVNRVVQPIVLSFGRLLFEYIDPKTFVDGPSDARNLDLVLLTKESKALGVDSWIQLNKNILLLYGSLTLTGYQNNPSKNFEYLLKATNSRGASVKTQITLIPPTDLFTYSFKIRLVVNMFYKYDVAIADEMLLVVTKLNQFFRSFLRSGIQLVTFQRQSDINKIEIEWTLDTLNNKLCPFSTINEISSILFANGDPSAGFRNVMQPEYQIFSLQLIKVYPCSVITPSTSHTSTNPYPPSTTTTTPSRISPPLPTGNLPTFYPQVCSIFIYYLPNKVFVNADDGTSEGITITLLQLNGYPLGSDSWISFNPKYNYMYGMISDTQLRTQKQNLTYKLRGRSSEGLFADIDIFFVLPKYKKSSHQIAMVFETTKSAELKSDVVILLLGKLNSYLHVVNDIRLLSVERLASTYWSLKFASCNSSIERCYPDETQKFKDYFFTENNAIKTSFVNFLSPEVTVVQMTFSRGDCLMPTTTTTIPTNPTTKMPVINVPPIVLKTIPMLNVSSSKKFYYKLEEDVFFDVEDGLTRNLALKLLTKAGEELPKEEWLIFQSTSNVLVGVLTVNEEMKQKEFVYKLVATDKGGLSAHQYVTIVVNQTREYSEYLINSYGLIYEQMKLSELQLLICDRLNEYVIRRTELNWVGIEIYSVTTFQENSKETVNLKWSIQGFNCEDMPKLRSLLFAAENAVNVKLVVLFEPTVIITKIDIRIPHHCSQSTPTTPTISPATSTAPSTAPTTSPNTPPIVYLPVPVLTVTKCTTFQYQISSSTCFDKEDGFTPKLILKLLTLNYTDIGQDSWIHLNQATQKLYGILKTDDIIQSVNGVFTFFLACEDRQGLSVYQRVHIMLQSSSVAPPYQFVMKSYIYVNSASNDAEIQFLWLQKIKKYLAESIDGIQIKSFQKSTVLYPTIVVTWYKCSIEDPCSRDAQELKQKLLSDRNHQSMNTNFSQSMVPEFVMISGAFQIFKSCPPASTSSTTLTTPTSTPSKNHRPVALIKNLQILLDNCKELQYQIPSDTFFDQEDGYTPYLKLTMKNMDGSDISYQRTCLRFNSTTQTINAIYVMDEMKTNMKFLLVATDKRGASSSSIVTIVLKNVLEGVSHSFTASARIYNLPNDKVTVLSNFKKKLAEYYNNKAKDDVLFIKYSARNSDVEIEWSNCSLSNTCSPTSLEAVKSKIFLYEQLVYSKFIAHMAPKFVITYVRFSYFDNCSPGTTEKPQTSTTITQPPSTTTTTTLTVFPPQNSPPKVIEQIPYINVPLCSPFSYRIPEKTFYDAEEGSTRNLRLEMKEYNDTPLPQSSWMQLVERTQVIYGHFRVSEKSFGQFQNYILKAYDQNNASAITIITLVLPEKKQIFYKINSTFTNFFDSHTHSLVSQLFLVSKIASYVVDDDITKIMVLSFTRTTQTIRMSWTNCTMDDRCDKHLVERNINKFILPNGFPTQEFKNTMQPYYTILSIKSEIKETCDIIPTTTPSLTTTSPSTVSPNNPPYINRLIPVIEVKMCQAFSYRIPNDVFIDEDGKTPQLSLQLLDIFGEKVSRESWVQLREKNQLIYGVMKLHDAAKQPVHGYRYILKATDSEGLSASIIVTFRAVSGTLTVSFKVRFEIKCSTTSAMPYVDDIFQINSRLRKYFQDTGLDTIMVVNFYEKQSTPGVIVYEWTNCTFNFSTCPVNKINLFKLKSSNMNGINEQLGSNYQLLDVAFTYEPPCIAPTATTLPAPSGDPPTIRNYIPTIIVRKCSRLNFLIPANTFYDPQDGGTRNMELSLTFLNKTNLSSDYWVQFNKSTQTIEGLTALVNVKAPFDVYLFALTARDSAQNTAFMVVRVDVYPIEKNAQIFQNITLSLKENFQIPDVNQNVLRDDLLKRIAKFYGDSNTYYIKLQQFTIENNMLVIGWSNCSVINISCNRNISSWIHDKIMDQTGICRAQFAFIFLPEYTVNELTISNDPSCGITPTISPLPTTLSSSSSVAPFPDTIKTLKNISLALSYCMEVSYNIPENLFYDETDGNSRQFTYSLHFTDDLPVTCNSWLQYNRSLNLLFGNLLQTDQVSPKTYKLRAQNDVGSSAMNFINIDTSKLELKNVSYKAAFSFRTTLPTATCDAEILHILRRKLVKYFGAESEKFISFIYFSRGNVDRPNYVIWTNCSIRTDICDFPVINEISAKMLFSNGTIVPRFKAMLQPEFTELSVLDEKIGPCSMQQILSVGKTLDPVCVQVCGKFTYKLPHSLFVNSEGVRDEESIIELLDTNGVPVSADSWIQLDEQNEEVFGFPTKEIIENVPKDGYQYIVIAYNLMGSAAQTTITLKFCGSIPAYKKSLTMELQCDEEISHPIDVVVNTLETITRVYAEHLENIYLVNFSSNTDRINITWTNCSEYFVYETETLNNNTTSNLSCSLVRNTERDQTDYPPQSSKEILRFKMLFCGSNVFPIEENDIIDQEDGNLTRLESYLTFSNGSKVGNTFWIVLLHNPIRILALPKNSTTSQKIYEFSLVGEDKIQQTASIKVFVELFDIIPVINYVVSIRFVSSMNIPVIAKIDRFLSKLSAFLSSNNTAIILHYNSYDNGTIDFQYGNCSLSNTECSHSYIDRIETRLETKYNRMSSDLITSLFPECYVEYIKTEKLGICLFPPNVKPKVKILQTNLTVHECGITQHQIPENTFADVEDGDTRNLSLKLFHSGSCWLSFNETSQVITTFYNQNAFQNQLNDGYAFQLQATDAGGKSSNTTIFIKFSSPMNSSFQLVVLFELKRKFSCFDESLYILRKFMEYFNTSKELGLVSLSKGPNNVFMEVVLKNCSLKYSPCDFKAIDTMTASLSDNGRLQKMFLDFMQVDSFYIPRYISQKKDEPCLDRSNQKPVIRDHFNQINISACRNESRVPFSKDLITDAEDGDWTTMHTKLIDATTGFEVGNNSWIYLDKEKGVLIVIYVLSVAILQPKDTGYAFYIRSTDSRQAVASFPLNVYFEETKRNITFKFYTVISFEGTSFLDPTMRWKQEIEANTNATVELLSYKISDKFIMLDWTVCVNDTETCDNDKIKTIAAYHKSNNFTLNMTKYGPCLHSFSTPNVTNITISLDPCDKLRYQLPEHMFQDTKDGGTSNLTIKMTQIYPEQLASFIEYNNNSQQLTGILPLQYFEKFEFLEYMVNARNSDGISVNATLRFIVNKTIRHFEYEITAILYKPHSSDYKFIQQFCNTLAKYLQDVNSGVVIYKWQAITGRVLPSYKIIFTPCALVGADCSKQTIQNISRKLFFDDNKINAKFAQALINEIALEEIKIRKLTACGDLDVGTLIGTLTVHICGRNYFQLPNDTFISAQTTFPNMTIEVKDISHFSWVKFNSSSKRFRFQPTLTQLLQQPKDGYNLTLKAVDDFGNRAYQVFKVLVEGNKSDFNFVISLHLTRQNQNVDTSIHFLQTRLDSLFSGEKFDAQIVDLKQNNDEINVTIYDCSLNKKYCQTYKNQQLLSTLVNNDGSIKQNVKTAFNPEYEVVRIRGENLEKCTKTPKDVPYITDDLPLLNLSLCDKLLYTIPVGLFMDEVDGDLTSSAELCNNNGKPLTTDSFLQYQQSRQTIIGFITQMELEKYTSKQLTFYLKVSSSRQQSLNVTIYVNLPEKINNAFLVTTTSVTYRTYDTSLEYLLDICNRIKKYFGDSLETISIVEMIKTYRTQGQWVEFTWSNCSLIKTQCDITELHNISSKIFRLDGSTISEFMNPFYKKALGENSGFYAEKTTTRKSGVCLHPDGNNKPVAMANVTLNISICGHFEYKLREDLFIDEENGSIQNLSLTLKFPDLTSVGQDFWIAYNDTSKTIYGLLTEEAANNTYNSYVFILQATDDSGMSSNTFLFVNLNTSDQKLPTAEEGYITSYIQCTKEVKPTLRKVINFFRSIGEVDNIRLKWFVINGSSFTIRWNHCNQDQTLFLKNITNATIEDCNVINHDISTTTIPTTTTTTATATAATTTTTNQSPQLVNSINELIITCGVPISMNIPDNTFYDEEDGNTSNLTLRLLDSQNKVVDNDNFIILSNSTNNIEAFISTEECLRTPGDTFFKVEARDRQGKSVSDSFRTKKISTTVSCCISIVMEVNRDIKSVEDLRIIITTLKNEVYASGSDQLVVVSLRNVSSQTTWITITNKTITNTTCTHTAVQPFTTPVIVPGTNNTMTSLFQTRMAKYDVDIVRIVSNKACNETDTITPFVAPPEASVGQFISSEDWFLYLLPLFILAFMLLMCCLCYYCCRCCYRNCIGTKNKPLMVEDSFDAIDAAPMVAYSEIPSEQVSPLDSPTDRKDSKPTFGGWDSPDNLIPLPIDKDEPDISGGVAPIGRTEKRPTVVTEIPQKQSEVSIQEAVNDDFDLDMYATATTTKKRENQETTRRIATRNQQNSFSKKLIKSDPITTSYVGPRSRQGTATINHEHHIGTIPRRRILRLPAIPKEPPPPYSPPRRHRIIRQNVLPNYYERYLRRKRYASPVLIPTSPQILRRHKETITLPSKRKIMSLPILKRKHKKRNRVLTPVITIPATDTSTASNTSSASSVEMKAILKGKQHALKRFLRNSPISIPPPSSKKQEKRIVEIPTVSQRKKSVSSLHELSPIPNVRYQGHKKFKHKLARPFLYDYIPVRRKSSFKKYKLESNKENSNINSSNATTHTTTTTTTHPATTTLLSSIRRRPPTLEELLDESKE